MMRLFPRAIGLTILTSGFFIGCATGPSPSIMTATQPHAQCLVCKYNADLACIEVVVNKDTSRALYNGRTYYFCSEDCRREFLKNPQKYAGLASP